MSRWIDDDGDVTNGPVTEAHTAAMAAKDFILACHNVGVALQHGRIDGFDRVLHNPLTTAAAVSAWRR